MQISGKAIGKYILIRHIDEDIKTASGILLSGDDANKLRYRKGEVVSPGTEVTKIKEGDIIYYDKVSGFTMIINEEQFILIQERDVFFVV